MFKPVRYLKFNSQQEAIEVLTNNGASFDEYFSHFSDCGWGVLFEYNAEWLCNCYDYSGDSFDSFEIAVPKNPLNVRA